jgi:hypothetical protein
MPTVCHAVHADLAAHLVVARQPRVRQGNTSAVAGWAGGMATAMAGRRVRHGVGQPRWGCSSVAAEQRWPRWAVPRQQVSGAPARRVCTNEELSLPFFDLLLVFFVLLFGLFGRSVFDSICWPVVLYSVYIWRYEMCHVLDSFSQNHCACAFEFLFIWILMRLFLGKNSEAYCFQFTFGFEFESSVDFHHPYRQCQTKNKKI